MHLHLLACSNIGFSPNLSKSVKNWFLTISVSVSLHRCLRNKEPSRGSPGEAQIPAGHAAREPHGRGEPYPAGRCPSTLGLRGGGNGKAKAEPARRALEDTVLPERLLCVMASGFPPGSRCREARRGSPPPRARVPRDRAPRSGRRGCSRPGSRAWGLGRLSHPLLNRQARDTRGSPRRWLGLDCGPSKVREGGRGQ